MNTLGLAAVFALAALAALRPALAPRARAVEPGSRAAVWHAVFEGTPLTFTPLLPMEARLAEGFPGAIASFDAEGTRIVMRRITQATRQLHPAETCLRAAGFSVRPLPARRHPETGLWGVVRAEKAGQVYLVREKIRSADGAHTWTDVSAWYWNALLYPERGPWIATTVIEPGPQWP